MNFIKLKSNRGLVNLFTDFILLEIIENEKYDAIIEVTDFGRFFVVNGITSRKEILNLSDITLKFKNEYNNLLSELNYEEINIIDLIIYDNELIKKEEFWFTFYDTERPCYSQKIIEQSITNLNYQKISNSSVELDFSENGTDDLDFFTYSPLNISSEFPHGYSFNMGRGYYYYSEYICNHLFKTLICDEIKFKCSTVKNLNDDYNINIITDSIYNKEKMESLVLDVFDFNLNKFKNKLVGYNYIKDVTEPLGEKPWLVKDEIKNIIIF
jgi:hypothetical protein